jgi:hypothetical protein
MVKISCGVRLSSSDDTRLNILTNPSSLILVICLLDIPLNVPNELNGFDITIYNINTTTNTVNAIFFINY